MIESAAFSALGAVGTAGLVLTASSLFKIAIFSFVLFYPLARLSP
jgi:hypothetical protein